MVCEHLRALEAEMLAAGIKELHRGQAWSRNCREWAYFACVLDIAALRARLHFEACVEDHEHRGTHDGSEAGLVCARCHDAIMGAHPADARALPRFS